MTTIDVRVQFKSETGEYPIWAFNNNKKTRYNQKYFLTYRSYEKTEKRFIDGKLKSIYGKWLEEKLNEKNIRDIFYKEEKLHPNINRNEYLIQKYIMWLENRFINKNNA